MKQGLLTLLGCSTLAAGCTPAVETFASTGATSTKPAPLRPLLALLFFAACSTPGASSPNPTSTTTTTTTTTTGPAASETATSVTITTDPDSTTTTDCLFLGCADVGPSPFECSILDDSCPPGEKCSAYGSQGGTWDATRCVPVAADPDDIDDPCTVETTPLTGVDSCRRGATCWFIEADNDGTGTGRCVPTCVGSTSAPTCEDAWRTCYIGTGGFLALCLPYCDPLQPGLCPDDRTCVMVDWSPDCVRLPADPPGPFEACEQLCAPGLHCADAASLGGCPGDAKRCCSPYCDLGAPSCPEGTACTSFFPRGSATVGFEALGLCAASR